MAGILLCLLLSGCGYSFRPKTEGVKSTGVLTFVNETFKPGLESRARDLLLQTLAERKVPVAAPAEAAWNLQGTITRWSAAPVAFDNQGIAREYRLTITMTAVLKERASQKTLWEEDLSASTYYYTGSNVAATEIAQNDGAYRALIELSERLTSRLMEDF